MINGRIRQSGIRLAGAVRRHGVRRTAVRVVEIWRGKVAQFGSVSGALRSLVRTAPPLHWSPALVDDIGVVPAVRTPNDEDRAFEIPFAAPVGHAVTRVAVIAHVFYVEYAEEMLRHIGNIPVAADLFVSTDTEQKKATLEEIFSAHRGGTTEIRVTPNRGRDVAPKLVGFHDVYPRYEYFVHLHSKRSPHGGDALSGWRSYLFEHLLGSPEIVNANLALLSTDNIGVVFPQHLFAVRGVLNWGYDFPFAQQLLARLGIRLTKDHLLEFPSGSMFWARRDAMRKLLALGLGFDDFEEEAGKVDGTLAHAIERSYLFFCEAAGYRWAKVARRDRYPLAGTLERVEDVDDIRIGMQRVFRSVLSPPQVVYSPFERSLPAVRRIRVTPSPIGRLRINLLIPTLNPHQVFGGVATAVKVFELLRSQLGDRVDARLVVTDAALEPAAIDAFSRYVVDGEVNGLDHEPLSIVDLSGRQAPLPLRRGDVFMASAWWNARQGHEFGRLQKLYFDRSMPFVYLIQDFEPNFYPWSSAWAEAANTYESPADTLAIVNSNELYRFMTRRHALKQAWVLPYEPNATIQAALRPVAKERLILIYGRPSVQRNCFEVIVSGLHAWQIANPAAAAGWQIVSLGETYPEPYAYPVQNFRVLGKVGLEEYAGLLSRAAVGISLMLSPHPSYPPLEMAMAGVLTVTNRYDEKDLAVYSDNIVNLDSLSVEDLAATLADVTARCAIGSSPDGFGNLRVPDPAGPPVDYGALAEKLREAHYTARQAASDPSGSP